MATKVLIKTAGELKYTESPSVTDLLLTKTDTGDLGWKVLGSDKVLLNVSGSVGFGSFELADYIELAGIKWATGNLIADPNDVTGMISIIAPKQDMYTDYYQWGRKKAWPATGSVTGWDSSTYVGANWLTENDPSPVGWRLPTQAELQALLNSGYSRRGSGSIYGNDVAGVFFGGNHAIATIDNLQGCIFLPNCGSRNNTTGAIAGQSSYAYYWSSTGSGSSASGLYISSPAQYVNVYSRALGYAVRCVKV